MVLHKGDKQSQSCKASTEVPWDVSPEKSECVGTWCWIAKQEEQEPCSRCEGKHLPKFFQLSGLLGECKAECERQQQAEMQRVLSSQDRRQSVKLNSISE